MISSGFERANCVLCTQPGEEPAETLEVLAAHTRSGVPCYVSCWKLTQEELEQILKTKRVWLIVYGDGHPNVAVCGEEPF